MNTKVIILLSAITFLSPCLGITPEMNMSHTSLFMGTIQFPQSLERIPDVRVYWSGHKITCDAHNDTKKLSFALPDEKYKRFFNILITESQNISFQSEENVVKFLKANPTADYKFYTMRLTTDRTTNPFVKKTNGAYIDTKKTDEDAPPAWKITEKKVSPSGRIPDETIIVCYNPDFVHIQSGGSPLELPTINVKHNVLELVGSEKKLHEMSVEQMIASLDLDTIHSNLHLESRTENQNKKIVALTV